MPLPMEAADKEPCETVARPMAWHRPFGDDELISQLETREQELIVSVADSSCAPTQDLETLVRNFRQFGCCAITTGLLDTNLLKRIEEEMVYQAKYNTFNRGSHRVCINDRYNIMKPCWWTLAETLSCRTSLVMQLLRRIYGEEFMFRDAGGDVIFAGADQSCSPVGWHRDWNLRDAMIAVSINVVPTSKTQGPLIMSVDGVPVSMDGPLGQIVVRDVSVLHRGSLNTSGLDRPTPTLRYYTRRAIEPSSGWWPGRFIPPRQVSRMGLDMFQLTAGLHT